MQLLEQPAEDAILSNTWKVSWTEWTHLEWWSEGTVRLSDGIEKICVWFSSLLGIGTSGVSQLSPLKLKWFGSALKLLVDKPCQVMFSKGLIIIKNATDCRKQRTFLGAKAAGDPYSVPQLPFASARQLYFSSLPFSHFSLHPSNPKP